MANETRELLFETLLDSWDRNNMILVNLLRAVPEAGLEHEGYHHDQIKLVLKMAGRPIPNQQAGPLTWALWMNKAWKGMMSE